MSIVRMKTVSYTHLDVYKRQLFGLFFFDWAGGARFLSAVGFLCRPVVLGNHIRYSIHFRVKEAQGP